MRRHDLANKKTITKTKTITITKTFIEFPQRAILETFKRHLIRVMRRHDRTKIDNDNDIKRTPPKSNPRNL